MEYKTIRIYRQVQEDPTLQNLEERMIINYVLNWQLQKKCCFASEDYLAGLLGNTPLKARGVINGLAARGRLKIHYAPNSNARLLSVNLPGQDDPCDFQVSDVFDLDQDF